MITEARARETAAELCRRGMARAAMVSLVGPSIYSVQTTDQGGFVVAERSLSGNLIEYGREVFNSLFDAIDAMRDMAHFGGLLP